MLAVESKQKDVYIKHWYPSVFLILLTLGFTAYYGKDLKILKEFTQKQEVIETTIEKHDRMFSQYNARISVVETSITEYLDGLKDDLELIKEDVKEVKEGIDHIKDDIEEK